MDIPDSWRSQDRRRILLALGLTLVFHVAVVLGTPREGFIFKSDTERRTQPAYEIALVPPEPEEMQFVQTNPEVPENKPDETANFASRDQQAAQEDPDPRSEDSMPTVEGEMEESNQILEGTLEEPMPQFPPPSRQQTPQPSNPEAQPNPAPEQRNVSDEAARPEIRGIQDENPTPPAPDFIRQEPESVEGPGSTSGPVGESREVPDETVERVIPITAPLPVEENPEEGAIQQPSESDPSAEQNPQQEASNPAAADNPPMPRPRPRLRPNVVPAPLMESNQRASRTGAISVDANFSEFGDYLQRMVEAVSRAWNSSVDRVELIKERPSRVKVRFTIDSSGNVRNMRVIDKTPNAELLATGLCMDAIQSRAPYDRWTYDMVQTLGSEQEITFAFYYR